MAVKSVIQIDVNDKNFQNFLKTYNQYKASLQSMPSAWKKINQVTNGTAISFRGLVADMVAANVKQKLMLQAQERADQITKTTADRWKDMARSARSVASYVTETTRQLLRWASLGGIIGGLVGAGSLWGLDRLGSNVAGGRRASLGLGVSYGQRRAFELNYGRVVDPNTVLGGVNEALSDVTKRYTLYGAGLSERDLAGKNAAEVSSLLVSRLKTLADQTPQAQLGNVSAARGLGQFVTLQDLVRLKNTPGAEIAGIGASYGRDINSLSLTEQTQKSWQDFTIQLSRAGEQIETVFQKKLVALAPGLTSLSDSVVKVVGNLNSDEFNSWIKQLGKGIESFAEYLGGDDFQAAVKTFVEDFDAVSRVVHKVASVLPKPSGGIGSFDPHIVPGSIADRVRKGFNWLGSHSGQGEKLLNWITGNNDDLLGRIRRAENSGDAAVSPKGAIGRYQIMPDTARQYGFDPSRLTDPGYNETVARSILGDLVRRYHGNTAEVLAAYNAGPGRANKFRDAGDDPRTLPRETQKYLERGGVKVVIEDNTGGNVNISTSKLVKSP